MSAVPTSTAAALVSSAASAVAARVTTFTPTIVATAGSFVTLSVAASAAPAKAAAQSILDPSSAPPNKYSASDPVKLFIIQAVIIIAISRILAIGLARLRQPKVISEVITGLIIGPSIMGRIPGFTANVFPPASISGLTLVANIGLILFLFLVGLEADFSVFKKNARAAIAISVVGLVVPFGLGAAVSVGVYNKFIDSEAVHFGIFMLFIGTAMAITAFPVLARILTELKLLQNPVGLTTLAAGVGNDVVGWILLALSVALANAGGGLVALYILLTGVGLVLVLYFLVRPVFVHLCRKSGSFENGPTAGIMMLTFFLILVTAWFTDVIGIHPIFGSFLVGLIVVPHHHGFGAALTEKMEDLVSILFIPIYFALSGLNTNLGLLNNGSIWGYTVCVCVVAFAGKFISCSAAAKWGGFDWRESGAIGSLMACKGLVELIVLNIGLTAGILNEATFAMFVVMALVTTFATTPLTLAFYPESYRKSKTDAATALALSEKGEGRGDTHAHEGFRKRFVVVLERLESLPSMMSFVRLLGPAISTPGQTTPSSDVGSSDGKRSMEGQGATHTLENNTSASTAHAASFAVNVDAFRLLALSDRTSALLRASEVEVTKKADSILNIFSAFANLASIRHTTSMTIVPQEDYAETVTGHVEATNADMVIVPWASGTSLNPEDDGPSGNPLESVFGKQIIERSPQYAAFVRKVFVESGSDVGLFLDGGVATSSLSTNGGHQHIFLPFHGGPDDRAALDFVMQLVANNSSMTATVSRFVQVAPGHGDDDSEISKDNTGAGNEAAGSISSPLSAVHQLTIGAGLGAQDTVYAGNHNTQHRMASDTADNLALAKYFPSAMLDNAETAPLLPYAVARVTFESISTASPLQATLAQLRKLTSGSRAVLVITGRSRRSAPTHRVELEQYLKEKVVAGSGIHSLGIAASSEVRKTLGDVGSALVVSGETGSILIFQSAIKGEAYLKGRKGKGV